MTPIALAVVTLCFVSLSYMVALIGIKYSKTKTERITLAIVNVLVVVVFLAAIGAIPVDNV